LPPVQAAEGLVDLQSQFSVQETIDRYEAAAKQAGMKIFTRVDHAAGAAGVGKPLRPTTLLIFGNPKVGTELMLSDQRAGIDLPMKALAWQDAEGLVWLSYNRPAYLFSRHNIEGRVKIQEKMTGALAKFAKAATQP
jgi:uncharacterized protein (DUF302 family)